MIDVFYWVTRKNNNILLSYHVRNLYFLHFWLIKCNRVRIHSKLNSIATAFAIAILQGLQLAQVDQVAQKLEQLVML